MSSRMIRISILIPLIALPFTTLIAVSLADEHDAKSAPTTAPAQSKAEAQAAREARFKEMMTDVVLRGTWQMTNAEGLKGQAPLSPPRPDRYTIKGVSKGYGDQWIITARVEYADRDAVLPFTVRVVWADETPIITLDKTALPLLGTYSARVMIFDGFYAGAWFGTTYGGTMAGQIIKAKDIERIEKMAASQPAADLPPRPRTESSESR